MAEEKSKETEKDSTKKPEWVKLSPKEIEALIVDLSKKGNTPAKIGLILRDQYGIPKVRSVLNKKLVAIMKENNAHPITEKKIMEKKIDTLKGHITKNKHDYQALRSLAKKQWGLLRATD